MPCPAVRLMFPLFLDRSVLKRKPPQALQTPWCRKWDQPVAPFSWQTGPFYLCSALLPFHTQRFYSNCSAAAPRGRKSWEQNVNSSTADKHAGRNPVLPCKLPWLAYLIYFLLFHRNRIHRNKRDLCLFKANNVSTLSQLPRITGLRNSCAHLRWNKAALSRNWFKNSPEHPEKWKR